MSELASRLLKLIGAYEPIHFYNLWGYLLDDTSFDEMRDAISELLDAHKIEQSTVFAYRIKQSA